MPPNAEDGSPSEEPDFDESGIMAEAKMERASSEEKSSSKSSNGNTTPVKSNAKDPSRPRRKKARRACFACQRAHLTCGDERPCLRCIKRGLQDHCHDGVRKKAKYLHDAPAEALLPGFGGNFHGLPHAPAPPGMGPNGMNVSPGGHYFQPPAVINYPQYAQVDPQIQMHAPLMESPLVNSFTAQQNVETPQYQSGSSQQVSPVQELTANLDTTQAFNNTGTGSFDGTYIDPNDPSLYNFNISDLNFGNHYGALEFGMLGHMSSGAAGTPDLEVTNSMGQLNQGSISYDNPNLQTDYGFNQSFPSWQSVPNTGSRQGSTNAVWNAQGMGMDAYAIGEQATTLTSSSPHSQDFNAFVTSPDTQYAQPDLGSHQDLLRQTFLQSQQPPRKQSAFPDGPNPDLSRKRRRNTSEIYNAVKKPYSYTQGFHALTAFLQKRFPSKKVLRIAKALATIRPSFISCNKNLNNDDLIFMEKCFQRTLCEYEDFVNHYGTPTIICRRTGEIAAVSKEFSLVTGWRRDVLLGKEPNLNINTGGNASGTQTGTSSRGAMTPRVPNLEVDPGRPQPVFLAELLDEDSVVQFYEDFAELAFGASRTSIIGAPCSLLKYRTKDDPGWGPNDHLTDDGKRIKKSGDGDSSDPLIRGEAGMNALGERDGRVDCSMCWTVKRDVFDIPMLIVMNFLPII